MSGGPSFSDVKDAALAQIETLAAKLLPHGQKKGGWWVAKCPWRDDRKPSLGVSLTTGNWKDWGRAEGGTMIDLVMRLDNCDNRTALKTLAGILGLTEASQRPEKPKWKSCAGCKWLWERFEDADYCTQVVDPLTEEPLPISDARRPSKPCGTHAKLYQAAT